MGGVFGKTERVPRLAVPDTGSCLPIGMALGADLAAQREQLPPALAYAFPSRKPTQEEVDNAKKSGSKGLGCSYEGAGRVVRLAGVARLRCMLESTSGLAREYLLDTISAPLLAEDAERFNEFVQR